MKEFDLEAAKAGKKVQLRSGREARIISFDRKDPVKPIVALVKDDKGMENVHYYAPNGKRTADQPYLDLVMASEKIVYYVNIYKNDDRLFYKQLFETHEEAYRYAMSLLSVDLKINYITTTKLEWEE